MRSFHLFFIFSLTFFTDILFSLPTDDISALKQLYISTGGNNWIWKGAYWNFSAVAPNPCGGWQGITCDSNSRVIKISLSGVKMGGTLPPHLGNITLLQQLSLSKNKLFGEIPKTISSLVSLQSLDLSGNLFQTTLPSQIGDLSSLTNLNINTNKFFGLLPNTMDRLINLKLIDISLNAFTGTLPSSIYTLSKVQSLNIGTNLISGTLSNSLGSMKSMINITLNTNRFTGTIPSAIGILSNLRYIRLFQNKLTGTIPSQIASPTNLEYLSMYENKIRGVIPSSIGLRTKLIYLGLYSNVLTGTIPSELGALSLMQYFRTFNNSLTGRIPASLAGMTGSIIIRVNNNSHTGPMPSISNMPNLLYLDFQFNRHTGTLPPLYSNLTSLQYLYVHNNHIHGTIPSEYGLLKNIKYIRFNDNSLTGILPSSFTLLKNLQVLLVQRNNLIGHPGEAFDEKKQLLIQNIDLSENGFSGSLPSNIFLLNDLKTFAANQNCFVGSIPNTICSANSIQIISLNGIRGGDGCILSVSLIYQSTDISKIMLGSIPSCVWNLGNLTTIAMSGNGLRGNLYTPIINSKLRSVSLSNNQITSTIPISFQKWPFNHLDLSNNKLTGTWSEVPQDFQPNNTVIRLSVNRISGVMPLQFKTATNVNVLTGNSLSCSDGLPVYDPNYGSYVCGSSNLDNSLYVFVASLLVAMLCGICTIYIISKRVKMKIDVITDNNNNNNNNNSNNAIDTITNRENGNEIGYGNHSFNITNTTTNINNSSHHNNNSINSNILNSNGNNNNMIEISHEEKNTKVAVAEGYFQEFVHTFRQLHSWYHKTQEMITAIGEDKVPSLSEFFTILCEIRKVTIIIIWIVMLVCLPLYPTLKLYIDNGSSSTIDYQYNWRMSVVYMSGLWPAVVLVVIWNVAIIIFAYNLYNASKKHKLIVSEMRPSKHNNPIHAEKQELILQENKNYKQRISRNFIAIFILLCNIVIIILENGLYVTVQSSDYPSSWKTASQLLKAFADAIWIFIISALLSGVFRNRATFIWYRTLIFLINSVFAPFLVSMVLSDSCFKEIFVPPAPVRTSYNFLACLFFSFNIVTSQLSCTQFGPLGPIESSYTPSFIYNNGCSSSILTTYIPVFIYTYSIYAFILPWLLFIWPACIQKPSLIPNIIRRNLFFGILWPHQTEGTILLPADDFVIYFLGDIALLLTYGLASPPLAVCIAASIVINTVIIQIHMGRYLEYFSVLQNTELIPSATATSTSSYDFSGGLDDACTDCFGGLLQCLSIIILTTALFQGVILLDIVDDGSNGIENAFWPSVVLVLTAITVRIVRMFCKMRSDRRQNTDNELSQPQLQRQLQRHQLSNARIHTNDEIRASLFQPRVIDQAEDVHQVEVDDKAQYRGSNVGIRLNPMEQSTLFSLIESNPTSASLTVGDVATGTCAGTGTGVEIGLASGSGSGVAVAEAEV